MQNYIEITQDGIGRILRTQNLDSVVGLYTRKIETCTIILIASQKGISLIHNTGKIRSPDIINEFRWHQNIVFWEVVYNPTYYPKETRKDELSDMLFYYAQDLVNLIGNVKFRKILNQDGFRFHEALNGHVTFSIKGEIETKQEPNNIKASPHNGLRHNVNFVNNYFLDKEEYIPADLQFDGIDFTPLPKLFKRGEEVERMAKTARFLENSDTELALWSHHKHQDELEALGKSSEDANEESVTLGFSK